jgi:hypothetical protein
MAVGSVKEIKCDPNNNEHVTKIIVKFENITKPMEIERYTADFEFGRNNFLLLDVNFH